MLNYYAIIKELRVFADSAGYNVQFMDERIVPSATSRTIKVQRPEPQWSDKEMDEWRWQVYHEIGHCVPEMRDCFDIPVKYDIDMSKEEMIPAMLNLLDDYRQEKHDLGKFIGRDITLSKGHAAFLQDKMIPNVNKANMEEQSPFIKMMDAAVGATYRMRSEWQKDIIGSDEQYIQHYLPEQKEWYDKLLSYKDELNDVRTAEEEYALAKKIIEEVFDLDPEEEQEKAKPDGDSQEGGEGEDAAEAAEHGEGQKGKGKAGKAGKSKGDEKGARDTAGKIKYEDLLKHNHDENGASYAPLEIDYSGHRQGSNFIPTDDPVVRDFVKGEGVRTSSTEYINQIDDVGVSNGLANRIRKLLQVRSQSIKVYGQKRGRLSNKSLHRVTMREAGEYQRKVFKKKIDSNILDTSVTILSDFSGSMGGDKMVHNMASALLLNDTLAKIGVPVEIVGFTQHRSVSELYLFKTHKKSVSHDKLKERMGRAASHNMGNNADGEAILWTYDRLRRQDSKRKLLIVLSDGQPAAGGRGDIYQFTKDVVGNIERTRDVEIYGIGIMSDAVENIYKHNRVINHSSELEGAVLTVIKDYILNK